MALLDVVEVIRWLTSCAWLSSARVRPSRAVAAAVGGGTVAPQRQLFSAGAIRLDAGSAALRKSFENLLPFHFFSILKKILEELKGVPDLYNTSLLFL